MNESDLLMSTQVESNCTPKKPASGAMPLDYTVVKRNGLIVPFRPERIAMAIELAVRDTKKVQRDTPLPDELEALVKEVSAMVAGEAKQMAAHGTILTVEGIQDIVEVKLMEAGHHDIARDYIIYRDHHKKLRKDSPRNLKILRRDGVSFVRFNPMKIASAIERGFRDTLHLEGLTPHEVVEAVNQITRKVVDNAAQMHLEGNTLSVELIQDEIEKQLMRAGHLDVAKDYILFRAARKAEREQAGEEFFVEEVPLDETDGVFVVVCKDGSTTKTSPSLLRKTIAFAARGHEKLVDVDDLTRQSISQFYDGIKDYEVDQACIYAARAKVEQDPSYTYVAANLLLDALYREALGIDASHPKFKKIYREYFCDYFRIGVSHELIDPELLSFDLKKLSQAIDIEMDRNYTFLGLQTLYDRYFIHLDGKRLETPQIFWMRVAMGLARAEGQQKEQRAIEFYHVLSRFLFLSSTPTLFNSGTRHSQLSSCFLSTVMDDLAHIYKLISDDAQLSKWAGGLGNDWTNVRATGARIKGTNGKSQGIIPFLKVANDTAVAVNQCFAPETLIYTDQGVQSIADVEEGDLVLGISGQYRQVEEKYVYNQKDPMVSLTIEHAIGPIHVTAGHPFYAISGVSGAQAVEWLKEGKVSCKWIEAQDLEPGDYMAQVIPKEVVSVAGLAADDVRLYGILLGEGRLSKQGQQWEVSGARGTEAHLDFVRNYLHARGIDFRETSRGNTQQIHWSAERSAVCEGTTGHSICAGESAFPFSQEDLYDGKGNKRIAPRLAHLPRPQTVALLRGLLETGASASRSKGITFTSTSRALVEGLRYQLLRLGIPTGGRATSHRFDAHIPAVPELAEPLGLKAVAKRDWFTYNGHVFTRVKKKERSHLTPFVFDLKVEGDSSYMTTAGLAHNGGKRKGAMCAYLETWHLDIEDFLELRKNTGDERRRTHDMNTANWIPDLFMKRVQKNGKWTLFSPDDVPDLHHLYGKAFETRYAEYEKMADEGQIKLFKRIEALQLWRKMLGMLYETGHPWITFKDPSNIRSPQDHKGVVHSSNLCTEILLNTSAEETAVCNIGSINLAAHVTENGIDRPLLASTIRTAMRMLDNVIDINFYPTPEAKRANSLHRPVGLGLMGFQDALYTLGISYASPEAVKFADESMELISYHAILSSSELAKERGPYASYKGSKWDRGLLPIDTLKLLIEERGSEFVDVDTSCSLDWEPVRESVKRHGMRNSNTMAIAPTATIANISGVTQSIEPMYKHLFVKSNLSGEFTVLNPQLVYKLKELNLWDDEMIDDLKYFDGSILEIERVPDEVKKIFLTAFEIDHSWLIECASHRQKWIDMGQSLNLYLAEPSGKMLHMMYLSAWLKGLKTTYYLRSLGATRIEQSTTDINKRKLQPRWMKSESPSARVQVEREEKPIACSMEEGCESCQ